MKKIVTVLFLFIASMSFSQDWKYNFDEAKELAKKKIKILCLFFQDQIGVLLASD